jgi:hypothetical protein
LAARRKKRTDLKLLTSIVLTIISLTVRGQDSTDGLIGVYESMDNKFERYSILTLNKDKVFIYKYKVGGCQGEVKGKWTIENKKVRLTNDQEFLNHETIVYPDMSLTTWTVKKIGVKPDNLVDSGCVKENQLHIKKK